MKHTIRLHLTTAADRPVRALRTVGAIALVALGAGCSSGGGPDLGDPLPTTSDPPADSTASMWTSLGTSFVESAGDEAVSTLTGWALGQLGLSADDGTTEALDAIQDALAAIEQELSEIATEIDELTSETAVQTCEGLSSELTDDLAWIDTLLTHYNTFVCTARGNCQSGGTASNVDPAFLVQWMDQVLDTAGNGEGAMDAILDQIHEALIGATDGGIIKSCLDWHIPGMELPVNGSFNDAEYYTRVHPMAAYYYYYQTVATLMYVEALRYQAYLAVADEVDGMDPTTIKDYLLASDDPAVMTLMALAAGRMQTTWDHLRNQFNLVGAPYTNQDLLMENSATDPVLYVLSLEDFTAAAGESCTDLTTDNYDCPSVLRGPYDLDSSPITHVKFSSQDGPWTFAEETDLTALMNGWPSGDAWTYLQENNGTVTRGFKNMENKVLVVDHYLPSTLTLEHGSTGEFQNWTFEFVVFLDTNMNHGTTGLDGHLPVATQTAINHQLDFSQTSTDDDKYHVTGNGLVPHDFLTMSGYVRLNYDGPPTVTWNPPPGWLKISTSASPPPRIGGFHLPVIRINSIFPNSGLQATNVWGVPTMCRDDFEDWFASNVTPPQFQ
jgi:hypothetical protein